ncbi:ester cyclase [Tropicimonas isoalkanivorans]|uniref:SnoaL-like polyketide cyclase n=1 Tax=Tropicimonas isoalkanivorans TaxID=441112 RepID=A0A1I1DQY7_9RHOB|nr:ester cyclase [Tropicimonas isoalkanivorans]SFB74973.1 SnoaL-like polyketide cyclase [Tropicimonas isoalkanivorans]
MSCKVKLLQQFYDRIWVAGAVGEIDRFFNTQVEASGLMHELELTAVEFHDFAVALQEIMEVSQVTLEKTIEQGEWVSAMGTFEATLRASGRTITGSGMLMARIVDDRIVEAFNCVDFLSLFEKSGLLPENALALGMAGHRFT